MKERYWQPYWWRLRFRADDEREWSVMGPITRVPNAALGAGIEAWASSLLREAEDELDDLRGDLLLECFDGPAPADGTPPAYSAETRIAGRATPSTGDGVRAPSSLTDLPPRRAG